MDSQTTHTKTIASSEAQPHSGSSTPLPTQQSQSQMAPPPYAMAAADEFDATKADEYDEFDASKDSSALRQRQHHSTSAKEQLVSNNDVKNPGDVFTTAIPSHQQLPRQPEPVSASVTKPGVEHTTAVPPHQQTQQQPMSANTGVFYATAAVPPHQHVGTIYTETVCVQPGQVLILPPGAGHVPQRFQCPYCHKNIVTRIGKRPGAAAWFSCLGIALFFPFGCCLIPFCIPECQDTDHYCPSCNNRIASVSAC